MSATTTAAAPRTRNRRAKISPMGDMIKTRQVTFSPFAADNVNLTGETFVAAYDPLPDEMKTMLGLSFLRTKLMDSYADTSKDVMTELRNTYDGLMNGQWETRGEGAERTTLFFEAYAQINNTTVEYVRERVNAIEAGDDPVAKANLAGHRKHPQTVRVMAEIAAKKAAERAKAAREAAKNAPQVELSAL